MNTNIFIKTLDMSYENRTPDPGVIFHSEREIQYTSDIFRQQLKNYKMVQSMSCQGNCLDNDPAESFFHAIKVEKVYG